MATQPTSLDALASVLKMFQGTSQTQTSSGGSVTDTQVTSKNMSAEGLAAMLKQLIESNAGLAATAQGQKTAGLYNTSTNRLLTNDLMSRLAAQAASNSSTTTQTSTRTAAPATQTTRTPGALGENSDMLQKLILGYSAYQKLGGTQALKKTAGSAQEFMQSLLGSGADQMSSFPGVDTAAALNVGATTPTGLDFGTASATPGEANLQYGGGISYQPSAETMNYTPTAPDFGSASYTGANGYGDILASDFGGFTDAQIGTAPSAGEFTVPTEAQMAEDTTNFPTASGTSSASSSSGNQANPTASEVLSGASSVGNTTLNVGGAGGSAMSLYSGIGALTDSNSQNDVVGALNTYQGAQGAYQTYETYQNAAKAAEMANQANAAEGVTSAYTATDYMNYNWGTAGSGSALGYVGPVMKAFYAQNNPKGAQNPDYRPAVGSAILNYFGFGWASDIVHSVAEPALNAAMDAGTESMGTFGAVLADPIGAPLSGQYEIGDLVSSTLDPANMFGGNPGGSTGSLVAATVDPIGAALGDEGVFSVVKDTVDSALSLDPISGALGIGGGGGGKVICTELALQDRLSVDLYKKAISPELVMKGQLLRGYHVVGVPLVKLLRKSPFWAEKITPYVADYIRHKAGDRNLRGLLVKSILHPISWLLGFVNRDPSYYKVLYRRKRYGS